MTAPLQGRVLLAEDTPTVQRLVARLLTRAGIDVVAVDDGLACLQAALRETFDLILTDLEMPGLDGRRVAETLRAHGQEVPIVALTAEEGEAFRRVAPKHGFTDVVVKPVDAERLLEVCAEHLGESPVR